MRKKIDGEIGMKFAGAASMLLTRVFSTPLEANPRRLMFACGPAAAGTAIIDANRDLRFDMLAMGFTPGKEWKGPKEISIDEKRAGTWRRWTDCHFWAHSPHSPLYVLTQHPDVCFSYDGHSLVPLTGQPDNREEGLVLARALLRAAARLIPDDVERNTLM